MPLTGVRIFAEKWFASDEQFNQLYPLSIQALARRHWTPLSVARKAAGFLAAENNVRILDIGSGVGKFCLAAAYYKPNAFYYGIEQRKSLVSHAEKAREILHLQNVSFVNGNFTQLDFRKYDHFYFYNAFYENLAGTDKIDDSIDYSGELFNYYNRYLFKQLEKKPAGTRLATFHSMEEEIPQGYHVVGSEMDNLLKFWIKI
ncbi:MAG: methyltransferase domain-containing protein [Chitinophagaceae bacterium]|nr:methyltransferase domain-containing protein [Chitinophagaceae bacterium]MBP6214949.1 methyltransferase domain-containing protein [Chitinophagaceae bacterium]HQV60440.1 class I SAM-dependent methyltransferase [Chitinophagaceae bacterium]HQV86193.1 class I SAM-dependent methyltransferase [Chitinophagaceae bacterium]HQX72963.1 class I SAM-dependent methyltransferase [Chitinophagaceae bacterium]